MTRKQVAIRLGRSLATVRRLEGVLLHPRRDEQGVHRFDRDEVDELVDDVRRGYVSLAEALKPAAVGLSCATCNALREELEVVRETLATDHFQRARALETADAEHAAERSRLEADSAALVGALSRLLDVLEG